MQIDSFYKAVLFVVIVAVLSALPVIGFIKMKEANYAASLETQNWYMYGQPTKPEK